MKQIDVSEADMQRLVHQCDRDGEGSIDYNAFCSVFAADMPSPHNRVQATPTKLHLTSSFVSEQPIEFGICSLIRLHFANISSQMKQVQWKRV